MEIREPIAIGLSSEIIASEERWVLRFTCPGPDARYNSDWVQISSSEMPVFRQALVSGFERYLTLKALVSNNAQVEDTFERVTVRVGGFRDGVCIGGYHVLFQSQQRLSQILLELDKLPTRGDELVAAIEKASGLPWKATKSAPEILIAAPTQSPLAPDSAIVTTTRLDRPMAIDQMKAGEIRTRTPLSAPAPSIFKRLFGRD